MAKTTVFKGAATALITPTCESGVDYENYGKLIDWQIEKGIDALVIAATTGEGSTLSHKEHIEVMEYAVKRIAGRVPAIAGTGSNDTAFSISLTKEACDMGYDAMLLVTPYYNKTTQRGLVESFSKIADNSSKPCILYNVPSRTGLNICVPTYEALADHPNIVGVKEASGDLDQVKQLIDKCGDRLDVYSGNDDQIISVLEYGGKGVISVLSNPMPTETVLMCKKFFEGDVDGAKKMQADYLELINALFCEVNPIPVKAAMAAMGFCENYLRLPLVTMEPEHEENLLRLMREQGLNV